MFEFFLSVPDIAGMKRILIALLSVSLLFSPVVLTTGCKALPSTTAFKTAKGAAITAETALAAWDDYIVRFNPSIEEERKVKAAFQKYQAAQMLLLDAAASLKRFEYAGSQPDADTMTKFNLAVSGAGAALSDLVNLIRTLGVKL